MMRRLFAFFKAAANDPSSSTADGPAKGGPARLEDDIHIAAQWISTALQSSGYDADFTPQSMQEVERFFDEQTKDSRAIPGGLLSQDYGRRLFALGSYCGEVLRRELGGNWVTDDNDPNGEINVTLELGNNVICWPVQRVMKRVNGRENSLVHWAISLRDGRGSIKTN